jgi:ribosome maturation factor RimP
MTNYYFRSLSCLLVLGLDIMMIQPSISWTTHQRLHFIKTTSTGRRQEQQQQQQNSLSAAASATTTTTTTFTRSSSSTTSLWAVPLPAGYQEFGESVIRKAGADCGIENDDDLTIEWKTGLIIVTVRAEAYASAPNIDIEEGEASLISEEDDAEDDDDDGENEDEDEDDGEDSLEEEQEQPNSGVDVTKLGKAINSGLDDVDGDGVGFAIAQAHSIEVTTPGSSEELSGTTMFQAYKGFDVICQQMDTKTKKIRHIEGRLVERNDEFTIINIKGRMKKMKNDTVLSVRLPKAKKEKGVK